MRTTRIAVLTGCAAAVLAGCTSLAEAKAPRTHVLTIPLPSGQLEQVRYTGDVPPTIIVAPALMPMSGVPVSVDSSSPFAMLEQISAMMDRQADALFRAVAADGSPDVMVNGATPALSGAGVCMHSVQITYRGDGQAPHVVARTAGDCGAGGGAAAPVALPNMTAPRPAPPVIQAKSDTSYRHLIHTVSDRR